MLASALLALATVAQIVAGQTVTPPANTPACLLTCASQFCPDSSIQCLCVTELSNVTACATTSCPPADLTTAAQIASQICANLPNASTTTTEAGTSSTATVSGSESASASGTATVTTPTIAITTGSSSASASASAKTSGGNQNKAISVFFVGVAGIVAGFTFF